MIDYGVVAEVISFVLFIVATYFGMKFAKVKKAINDVIVAMEITEKAIEDNKVTPDEVKQMVEAWKKVLQDV